jgi:multiple sugar transport system permease protein
MAVLTATQVRDSRTARLRRKIQDNLLAYAFMAAGLACFAFFSWYPLVRGVILSFQQNNFVVPPYWVGLENYRTLFDDPLFYTAWRNTLLFTGLLLFSSGEDR